MRRLPWAVAAVVGLVMGCSGNSQGPDNVANINVLPLGDDRFTVNFGLGMRLMPLDWLAVHADIRDHVFDIDLLGQEKTSHNLEAHLGVTFFF